MIATTVTVEDELYRCEARAHAWGLGVGVDVAVFKDEERVVSLRILCPMDSEEYGSLAALPEADRVRVALERFVQEKLNVTPKSLLESQQQIHSIAACGVTTIITSFAIVPNKP